MAALMCAHWWVFSLLSVLGEGQPDSTPALFFLSSRSKLLFLRFTFGEKCTVLHHTISVTLLLFFFCLSVLSAFLKRSVNQSKWKELYDNLNLSYLFSERGELLFSLLHVSKHYVIVNNQTKCPNNICHVLLQRNRYESYTPRLYYLCQLEKLHQLTKNELVKLIKRWFYLSRRC